MVQPLRAVCFWISTGGWAKRNLRLLGLGLSAHVAVRLSIIDGVYYDVGYDFECRGVDVGEIVVECVPGGVE